jgi:hypothetical protein
MGLLSVLVGSLRVLKRLSGEFVSGQVIFFSVMLGGSAMSMRGEHVKFSGLLVGVFHDLS